MKTLLIFIMSTTLLTQCATDRTILPLNQTELEIVEEFKSFEVDNRVQISAENEPGQKLWLCLTVVSKDSNEPIANQKVHLYHTSDAGEYENSDANDESTARLSGTSFTNNKGQLFVQTILPGDYGSSADNRHIHTAVENAHPEAYDINFKQYTGQMGRNFIAGSDQHFLADLKQTKDSILVAFLTIEVKNPQVQSASVNQGKTSCEWCGAKEAPLDTNWEATIANEDVAGERIILEGTVYKQDGKTPAKNVIVYAYHTNSNGVYEKKGDEEGNGKRHGFLRGWVKTNTEGKYRFHTIKPAPYPNNAEPAHVHLTLLGEDFDEYWINATWFKGDRIITNEMIENLTRKGGFSNIIDLAKNEKGVLVGTRDIIINPPKG